MLCQFQVYSKVNQLYIYIYPLLFRFFSHIGHYRVLSRVPCAIKKMWYIYTMEYYSAIKMKEIMPFAATWMDLEIVILSEVSQTEKRQISYDIAYMQKLKSGTNELIYKTEIVFSFFILHIQSSANSVCSIFKRHPESNFSYQFRYRKSHETHSYYQTKIN